MSTLVGIKRTPESGLGPITKLELIAVAGHDASLSFEKDGMPGLSWSGGEKSSGMEFNCRDGEIWSAGTPDDATLRKMQDIAHRLGATLVMEDGETFDLDAPTANADSEPLTRRKILFRVYVASLAIAAVFFFFTRR